MPFHAQETPHLNERPPAFERSIRSVDFTPPPRESDVATQIAKFEGAPHRFEMPERWSVAHESTIMNTSYRWSATAPNTTDTKLSIGSTGRPLSPESAKNLQDILQKTEPGKMLFDSAWKIQDTERGKGINEMMQKLAGSLGRSQLGDNQFTDHKGYEPTFNIDRMSVETVDGKKSLSFTGTFPIDGKPGRFLSATFVPFETPAGTGVTQIVLQGTDQMAYRANLPKYQESLQSLKWK